MKVRSMNSDQYKLSIEAHPLKVLYTKYNSNDVFSQYQSVRPLGRIRHGPRASSEYKDPGPSKSGGLGECIESHRDMKFNTRIHSERTRCRSDQNLTSLDLREKENTNIPLMSRSKTQAFENKFRIAAARSSAQDSPSPSLKSHKIFEKKTVHLPLFRINLKTYAGEEEVSRTVAKTRESLRQLMDLNKAKLRNANVTTANIRNYEFSAPRSGKGRARESYADSPKALASQPFHAKPALRTSRDREQKVRQTVYNKLPTRFSAVDNNITLDMKGKEKPTTEKAKTPKRWMSIAGSEDEPDESMLSLAIRPDTSLTLGTTMHQIDRVIRTPTSDELRELSDALKNSETQPAWPSVDDIQTLIARNHSRGGKNRTPFSRPGTVLRDVSECSEEEDIILSNRNRQRYICQASREHTNAHKAVLRYTSKESTYKLDPIIVPSHTCTECPMCNIYQRDIETPCPPNTPNTSQFMLETQNRPVFVRGTRVPGLYSNHEVMRITRINMNGRVQSPSEDPNVLSYMDAL